MFRMNVPYDMWINTLKVCAGMDEPIIRFNCNGLAYYEAALTPKPPLQLRAVSQGYVF